jgi:hypothetical protein
MINTNDVHSEGKYNDRTEWKLHKKREVKKIINNEKASE